MRASFFKGEGFFIDQLGWLVRGAAENDVKRMRCHILLDGRDMPDGSSVQHCVADLEKVLAELDAKGGDAKIAAGVGRMDATMDRCEVDWPTVERGWKAHALVEAEHTFPSGWLIRLIKLVNSTWCVLD